MWADLNKGAAIGSSSLRNRHSVRQIQMHLETKFNKHRPVDIQSIMDNFVLDVDGVFRADLCTSKVLCNKTGGQSTR
jgi:hypothetical protein